MPHVLSAPFPVPFDARSRRSSIRSRSSVAMLLCVQVSLLSCWLPPIVSIRWTRVYVGLAGLTAKWRWAFRRLRSVTKFLLHISEAWRTA